MTTWNDLLADDLDAEWNEALARRRAHAPEITDASELFEAADEGACFEVLGRRTGPFYYPYRASFPGLLAATRANPTAAACAGVLAFASVQACAGGSVDGMWDQKGRQLLEDERDWLPALAREKDRGTQSRLLAFEALASGQAAVAGALAPDDETVQVLSRALSARSRAAFDDWIRAFPITLTEGPPTTWFELVCVGRACVQHVEGRGPSAIGASIAYVRNLAFPPPAPPARAEPPPVRARDDAFSIRIPFKGEGNVAGRVTAITERPEWRDHRVSVGEAEFLITVPVGASMPFALGDAIEARVKWWVDGIHPINEACVTNERGELLAADSESGDVRWAPGWDVAVERRDDDPASPDPGFATRFTRGLRLTRNGASVIARGGWQRFEVAGEAWLVRGGAVEYVGAMVFRPGSKNGRAFSIIRQRGAR